MNYFRASRVVAKCILILTALVLVTEVSQAQRRAKPASLPLTLRVYTWSDVAKTSKQQEALPELYYKWRNKYILLNLRHAQATPFFQAARTEGELHFYKQVLSEDNEVVYQSAASVAIPSQTKKVFLYLFNSGQKVSLLPIDLNIRKFPKSSLSFYNQGAKDVILTLNGKRVKAKAKRLTVLPYAGNSNQTARILVQTYAKKPKNLAIMTIGVRPEQRLIGMFYRRERGGNYRVLIERGADSQAHKFR